ncbi:MAG: GIY-YIG nuclease family protein [Patescibacteria group bacterium]
MMYLVYIIQSEKDNSYYVGHTGNIENRLTEHNTKKCKYTSTKAPWKLRYIEKFETKGEAMKREDEIKRKKRKSYIEWLINNN